jgi:hypothetical protein
VFLNTENISAFVGFSWKIEIEMHGATMKIIFLCYFGPIATEVSEIERILITLYLAQE